MTSMCVVTPKKETYYAVRRCALYLALATLRVDPALLVHLFGDAHKVGLNNCILDSGHTQLLVVHLLRLLALVGLYLSVDLTPAPATIARLTAFLGIALSKDASD